MWQALVRSRVRRNLVAVGLALIVWAVLAAVFLAEQGAPLQPLHGLESSLLDLRLSLHQRPQPPSDVVIVAIDRASTQELGDWPWSRARLGELLDRLRLAGASTVVFLFPLAESPGGSAGTHLERVLAALDEISATARPGDPALAQAQQAAAAALIEVGGGDAELLAAMARTYVDDAALPVLAYRLRFDRSSANRRSSVLSRSGQRILADRATYQARTGHGDALQQRPQVVANGVEPLVRHLADQAAALGFTNRSGPDGPVRSVPIVGSVRPRGAGTQDEGPEKLQALMPLHVAAVSTHLRLGIEDLVLDLASQEMLFAAGNEAPRRFRFNPGLDALVDFYGPTGTIATYPAAEVMQERLTGVESEPVPLAGKLVLVGVTDPAFAAMVRTPVDPLMPEVELQATAAANLLEGRNLRWHAQRDRVALLTAFLTALVAALVAANLGPVLASAVLLAVATSAAALTSMQLASHGLVWSWTMPGLSLFLGFLAVVLLRRLAAATADRRIRTALSSGVSDRLVRAVLAQPEQPRLAGDRRECTVLASSVVDFEALVQRLARPQELLEVIGRHLGRMRTVIEEEHGHLCAEAGPSFMALFGAPVIHVDHAATACHAALRMQRALRRLNTVLDMEGHPGLSSSIGLASGTAVVGCLGNAGQCRYTALGEPLALAGQMERFNRVFGTTILVCGHTRATAGTSDPDLVFRAIDRVQVNGRAEPVDLFELAGSRARMSCDELEAITLFADALELYRESRFDQAAALLQQVHELAPGDGPTRLLLGRCAEHQAGNGN